MPHRIASLLPSATEIVCAVGARAELAGVSHECDFPAGVERLPVLTRARLRPLRTSGEIDAEVRSVLRNALAVYDVDLERLREAGADVIVTQDLCDVCAVSLDDVRAAVARLGVEGVRIVNLHPTVLADIWSDIERVAEALGRRLEGSRAITELRARVAAIEARATQLRGRPRVLTVEWLDPVMVAGMWMPELVTLAGGTPMVTQPGDHAPTLDIKALRALEPDVILVKPCGFPLERTLDEAWLLPRMLPWHEWRCVREGRVYVADGNAYFNRPGPRIVESLEILAGCLHPEAFADFRAKHRASVVRLGADLAAVPFDPMIHLKRAYEAPARGDGHRVLVERLWPRGLRKGDAHLDDWLKDVAPSTDLRKWFGHEEARWPEFQKRYRQELRGPEASAALEALAARARSGALTLVYAAHDEERNSAVVLKAALEGLSPAGRARSGRAAAAKGRSTITR